MENQDIKQKISQRLIEIRPYLQNDGGDIELVDILEDNTVVVNLLGACGTCPTSVYTLKMGVERYLKLHIPEVKEVILSSQLLEDI